MAFSAMFADFMWSRTFHAPSISFAKTRACKCSLNVTLLARIPLCQLLGVIEVICIEVRLEESVVIPGVQSNDRQPQSIIRVSTMNQCLDEAIIQQRVDGTIFHLEFSRKQQRLRDHPLLKGPGRWTTYVSPLSLMVHHFGIFEERVIDVDEVADHLRSAFVRHRVDEDVTYPASRCSRSGTKTL